MSNLVSVKGQKGRRYEVRAKLYGTCNYVYYLYYGGIYLSSTSIRGTNIEAAIKAADQRVEDLGIEIEE